MDISGVLKTVVGAAAELPINHTFMEEDDVTSAALREIEVAVQDQEATNVPMEIISICNTPEATLNLKASGNGGITIEKSNIETQIPIPESPSFMNQIIAPSTTGITLTSFERFPDLPIELRYMIWKHSWVPRVFVVHWWPALGKDRDDFDIRKGVDKPQAIAASGESYREALASKSYQLVDCCPRYYYDLDIECYRNRVEQTYMNFSIDTFILSCNLPLEDELDAIAVSPEISGWEWVQKARHLALHLELWTDSMRPFDSLMKFPQLKQLTIWTGAFGGLNTNTAKTKHTPEELRVVPICAEDGEDLYLNTNYQNQKVNCSDILKQFAQHQKEFPVWKAPTLKFGTIERADGAAWCFEECCPNYNGSDVDQVRKERLKKGLVAETCESCRAATPDQ